MDSRGTSIKTRIETPRQIRTKQRTRSAIREAHPLKQGLKPAISGGKSDGRVIREAHPLKQGLKRGIIDLIKVRFLKIREAHPLKQGLKLLCFPSNNTLSVIREAHPLKQGLKHQVSVFRPAPVSGIREAHPLKQGLKLRSPFGLKFEKFIFERHIH